ncbi:MAG: RyR domain-containing protein [Roseburia sp.]|nr:RyR domain-containing protein [Anaeroplasma bactoclasticum]MCM1196785.1 RyR domain-containing protein [Roseburia sp.]
MKKINLLSSYFFEQPNFKTENYRCLSRCLNRFSISGKKEDAFTVYYCFCEIFKVFGEKSNTMNKILQLLSDHENHSGELLSKHRDHYSHSVYVFALGLMIYANDFKFREAYAAFYKIDSYEHFLKYWGLTSLFHDIGYPFELAHQQIKSYTEDLWGEKSILSPFVSYEHMNGLLVVNEKTEELNRILALGVCDRLGYSFTEVYETLTNRYKDKPKYMDHAYFSAILLARQLIDNKLELADELLDVLTAIVLHNSLNKFDLVNAEPISVNQHPLAYLLMLCDEIQCWDRTAFGYVSKKDPLPWDIRFDFQHESIFIEYLFDSFFVDTPCEEHLKNKNVEAVIKKIEDLAKIVIPHRELFVSVVEEKKERKQTNFASTTNLINLCDFAKAIHKSYQVLWGGDDFDDLPLETKLSNIEQAKSYSEKLELINCFYSDKELDYPIVNNFSNNNYDIYRKKRTDDIEFLAREEHVRWVKEKLAAGWKYGETKDSSKKTHPDIVPYESLLDSEKEKDIVMIKNIIPFLYEQGHKVRVYRFRYGRKPTLDIAGVGHRTISSDKEQLKQEIKRILKEYEKDYRVIVRTAYAPGADQLIAECAIELGITIKAVLPYPTEKYIESLKKDAAESNYSFTEEDELRLRHLLAQTVVCRELKNKEHPYLAASEQLIKRCDKVIALWDGVKTPLEDHNHNPINQGGTYHCIKLALDKGLKENEDIHIVKCDR